MAGAQIQAGLDQRAVQPIKRGVERQHHERQVDIDKAHHHGEIVVDQRQRLERRQPRHQPPQGAQSGVDQPFGAQYRHQRIGADQQVGPERQHDRHQQQQLGAPARKGDGQRHRQAQDEAQQCGERGKAHGFQQDRQIQRLQRAGVIAPTAGDGDIHQRAVLAETIGPDHRQRRQEQREQPHHRRQANGRKHAGRLGRPLQHHAAITRVIASSTARMWPMP